MRLPNERIAAMLLLTAAAVPMTHARAQDWTPPRLHENKNYSHAWIDVDGVKTHYVEAGQGAPFVLIHGGGASSSGEVNYYDVIGPLRKKFHVIAPDIVGFGYTAPRGAQDYSRKGARRPPRSFHRSSRCGTGLSQRELPRWVPCPVRRSRAPGPGPEARDYEQPERDVSDPRAPRRRKLHLRAGGATGIQPGQWSRREPRWRDSISTRIW